MQPLARVYRGVFELICPGRWVTGDRDGHTSGASSRHRAAHAAEILRLPSNFFRSIEDQVPRLTVNCQCTLAVRQKHLLLPRQTNSLFHQRVVLLHHTASSSQYTAIQLLRSHASFIPTHRQMSSQFSVHCPSAASAVQLSPSKAGT